MTINLYEDLEEAMSIIKSAMEFVEQAHDDAECKHDELHGDYYMDADQYEIMQGTEALLAKMVAIINKFEKPES